MLTALTIRGNNNRLQGNYIGTNAAGTAPLIYPTLPGPIIPGFSQIPLITVSGNDNLIGGATPGAGNVISGLRSTGIRLAGQGNRLQGNLIGTQADGVSPLGNAGLGVIATPRNFVGGVAAGEGNIIANNYYGGVDGGIIRGNSIHSNQRLGIDNFSDYVTLNVPNENHSVPDQQQSMPVIKLALATNEGVRVQGTLNSYASSQYVIDVYANEVCNFSGFGEGKTYLGSTTINTGADFNATFSFVLPRSITVGQLITATATRVGGVTSEFSACVPVSSGCVGTYPLITALTDPMNFEKAALMGNAAFIPAAGAVGSIGIDTVGTCSWTANSNAAWLTLTSAATGNGQAELRFSATRNPGATSRSATITVGNNQMIFLQAGNAAVVSAASYLANDIAARGILSIFGTNLASQAQGANTVPLPVSLADTTVILNNGLGQPFAAPLFFASPGQINFLMPSAEYPFANDTLLTVYNRKGSVSQARFFIERMFSTAGGLFSANATGQGIAAGVALRVKADGAQAYESIARFDQAASRWVPIPIDLGSTQEQVYLVLFGTGMTYGQAATIAGLSVATSYQGPQGTLLGVDQVNLLLPRTLIGRGLVDIRMENRGRFTNTVQVQIR